MPDFFPWWVVHVIISWFSLRYRRKTQRLESMPMHLAGDPQTILALEMNGAPLPIEHGAPVRLRVETQLGFKMVKWITAIELVADPGDIGLGMGGWREDHQYYANAAGI